ncbi:MAG: endolytic transglycosylase MltG [Thiobacillaceae bacterium]|nr:endolytic transglycosylase MltG [Thiobacillaceae bacterium]
MMTRRPLVVLALVWATATLLALAWLVWYAHTPGGRGPFPVEVRIEAGASMREIARQLAAAGVLDHPAAFVWLARLQGLAGQAKAGGYLFTTAISPRELLRKLTEGENLMGRITFIEGWTFRQLRAAIDRHPHLRHDSARLTDAELLARLGIDAPHPEGLFFPDTYYFDIGSSDLELLARAHRQLQQVLDQAWRQRAPGLPYRTPYEALIMASIIEKETAVPEERPLIAAVFVNRLKLGMRLQTDPSVIYGLGERFDGNLRKEDLLLDTPYNTYTRAGLPPTPIALPGAEAIRAALNPQASRALYFVAKGNGYHHFSDDLDEHNRAVARYQRGQR